jgi:hypothetical protein
MYFCPYWLAGVLHVVRVAVTPLAVVSAHGKWSKAAVLSHIGGICTHHKMMWEMGVLL